MRFIDYFRTLEKRDLKRYLRNRILLECDIQVPTFYLYMRKGKFPLLVQEKIAEIMQKPQSELFPDDVLSEL